MAVKDGKAPKLHLKNAYNVTSEPIENDDFSYFSPAADAAAAAAPAAAAGG